jgi:predicted TIM-barrel fold metal-dependent hydrolase
MTVASWTAEELLKGLRQCGVQRAVLISHGSIYGFDNSYLIDSVARYPHRLRCVAGIDHDSCLPDTVESTMRSMLVRGVTGFRIERGARQKGDPGWLKSEGMARMWAVAGETRQAVCCMVHPEDLAHIGAMMARFPSTNVVIDHLGSIGENQCFGGSGIVKTWELEALLALATHPRCYVKVSAFYALGTGTAPYSDLIPAIGAVIGAFGVQRCMWGTDCPYQVHPFPGGHRGTIAGSLALVRDDLGLDQDELEWLLRKTAESVFFWESATHPKASL